MQADILRLPVPDASVDGATCGFALRNLVDLDAFFGELARVVRPGWPHRIARGRRTEESACCGSVTAVLRQGRASHRRAVVRRRGVSLPPEVGGISPRTRAMLASLRAAGFVNVERILLSTGISQLIVATRAMSALQSITRRVDADLDPIAIAGATASSGCTSEFALAGVGCAATVTLGRERHPRPRVGLTVGLDQQPERSRSHRHRRGCIRCARLRPRSRPTHRLARGARASSTGAIATATAGSRGPVAGEAPDIHDLVAIERPRPPPRRRRTTPDALRDHGRATIAELVRIRRRRTRRAARRSGTQGRARPRDLVIECDTDLPRERVLRRLAALSARATCSRCPRSRAHHPSCSWHDAATSCAPSPWPAPPDATPIRASTHAPRRRCSPRTRTASSTRSPSTWCTTRCLPGARISMPRPSHRS